jgi:hypothetical protein
MRKRRSPQKPELAAIRVELQAIPCPDLGERLTKIYDLALRRYHERHGIAAEAGDVTASNGVTEARPQAVR